MCYGCWEEYGKPTRVTPAIVETATLVEKLYASPGGGVGGNLHIVTDDWNLEDDNLAHCAERNSFPEDGRDNPITLKIEKDIIDAMRLMTEAERATVLALESGFIDASGKVVEAA